MVEGTRERRKRETRTRIVAVARALFAEQGYAETTVAEIATGAEISVPTFFSYFHTKDDLLFSDYPVREESLRRWLADRPEGQTAVEALGTWMIDELPRMIEQDPAWQAVLRRIVDADPPLRAEELSRIRRKEAAVVEAVAEELGEEPDDLRPQVVAAAALGAMTAVGRHCFFNRPKIEPRGERVRAVALANEFLLPGLEGVRNAELPKV
jgi:AcrR family transcriptional regulator